jgi:hypothetical protein
VRDANVPRESFACAISKRVPPRLLVARPRDIQPREGADAARAAAPALT